MPRIDSQADLDSRLATHWYEILLLRMKHFFSWHTPIEMPGREEAIERMAKNRDLFNGRPIREFKFGRSRRSAEQTEPTPQKTARLSQAASKR